MQTSLWLLWTHFCLCGNNLNSFSVVVMIVWPEEASRDGGGSFMVFESVVQMFLKG